MSNHQKQLVVRVKVGRDWEGGVDHDKINHTFNLKEEARRVKWPHFYSTARKDNVFTGVCHSVHNRPHGYSVTVHPIYSAVGARPTGMLSCYLPLSPGREGAFPTLFFASRLWQKAAANSQLILY